ncbi:Eco57I restriction-modification methylase domain-containing protein, partial [Campylobacter coli]
YKGENVYRIINKASVSKNLIFSNIALSAQNLNKQLVVHARDFNKNSKGFDLIIGNPPYIRQEELKELKPHLAKNYKVYKGTSDIYTYF